MSYGLMRRAGAELAVKAAVWHGRAGREDARKGTAAWPSRDALSDWVAQKQALLEAHPDSESRPGLASRGGVRPDPESGSGMTDYGGFNA